MGTLASTTSRELSFRGLSALFGKIPKESISFPYMDTHYNTLLFLKSTQRSKKTVGGDFEISCDVNRKG